MEEPTEIDRRARATQRALACTVLLGLVLASGQALAESTYSADATALTSAGFDANTDTGSGLAPDGAAVTGAGASGPNASAGATAQAGFQYVGVSANANGSGEGASSSANARTQSEFSIVPTDPTLWGTVGEIDIALSVNGSTGVAAGTGSGGRALVSWSADIAGTRVGEGAEERNENGLVTDSMELGTIFATLSLTLGPQSVHAFVLSAGVATVAGADATAVAAFDDTFAWGGILALRDAEGNAVASFTAPGEDPGADWRAAWTPIPEPSTALLLGIGLSVLATGRSGLRAAPTRSR